MGLLMSLALVAGAHSGPVPHEDFLQAADRIIWQAGGLYDGRFEDGTHFQIQLAYARPASVDEQAPPLAESYWYPKHIAGAAFPLRDTAGPADTHHLALQPDLDRTPEETFAITLGPDKRTGHGNWTSARLHKQLAFTLQRAFAYDYVVIKRPAPPEASQDNPGRNFVFAAYFPVLHDADADAWIRNQAGSCDGDLECINNVQVRWKSHALVSLEAEAWHYDYMAPHGNLSSTTRQYRSSGGRLTPVGLDAFVGSGAACGAALKTAIVGQLHAQQLEWADEWARNANMGDKHLKFTPTASGIAFHFDPYEVGPYIRGAPSVFVTRAQMGACARELPTDD